MAMKIFLRVASVVSFLAFVIAGLCMLGNTLGSPARDAFARSAIGFVFVGCGFFAGPLLLFMAERIPSSGKASEP
jgi:hypothetical protein